MSQKIKQYLKIEWGESVSLQHQINTVLACYLKMSHTRFSVKKKKKEFTVRYHFMSGA